MQTLKFILPVGRRRMKLLIVGERPSRPSVVAGHYLQGPHGRFFWCVLKDAGILDRGTCEFEDDALMRNGHGVMDVVRYPAGVGLDPSDDEWSRGLDRVVAAIRCHNPEVTLFLYKKPLWELIKRTTGVIHRPETGFDFVASDTLSTKIFVFAMPTRGRGIVEAFAICKRTLPDLREALRR